MTSNPRELAGLSERLFAFEIDFLVVLLAMSAGASVLSLARPSPAVEVAYGLAAIASFFAYHGILDVYPGQTLGKRLAGIQVLRLDKNAAGLGLGRSFLRSYGYLLSFLPLGLGFFWALTNAPRRCGHDYLAGTYVARVRETRRAALLAITAGAWGIVVLLGLGAFLRLAGAAGAAPLP